MVSLILEAGSGDGPGLAVYSVDVDDGVASALVEGNVVVAGAGKCLLGAAMLAAAIVASRAALSRLLPMVRLQLAAPGPRLQHRILIVLLRHLCSSTLLTSSEALPVATPPLRNT